MKKITTLVFTLLSLLSFNITTFANSEISIFYNNQTLEFSVAPEIINDVTMVPLRDIFESMGYTIEWDNETKTVTGEKDINTIKLTIGERIGHSNGNQITIPAPIIKNDYTLVPLRFVAESSGSTVEWNESSKTISIYSYEFFQDIANNELLTKSDIEHLKDTAVTIYTNKIQGSGIIISEDGYIVTNFHVIDGASSIQLRFNNGEIYQGLVYIAGYDYVNDIVIIKINKNNLSFANILSAKAPSPGDYVLAIGSPDGILNVASVGTIDETTSYVISSTTKISQGSSGGGLFNSNKDLIGITTATTNLDTSLSIPISLFANMKINNHIPLEQWKNIKPSLIAPKTVHVTKNENIINIRWSNVYGADGYKVYLSLDNGNSYTLLKDKSGSSLWKWSFPECISLSGIYTNDVMVKISTVKDGTEIKSTSPIKLTIK